jgi:hypothetical protein
MFMNITIHQQSPQPSPYNQNTYSLSPELPSFPTGEKARAHVHLYIIANYTRIKMNFEFNSPLQVTTVPANITTRAAIALHSKLPEACCLTWRKRIILYMLPPQHHFTSSTTTKHCDITLGKVFFCLFPCDSRRAETANVQNSTKSTSFYYCGQECFPSGDRRFFSLGE